MRRACEGPAGTAIAGLAAQAVLLAALAQTVALSAAGWVAGIVFACAVNVALARGLVRSGRHAPTPADWVTLLRATFVGGVTALVADGLVRPTSTPALVTLAALALVLDGVDGRVARRTHTATRLGARFDMEVDAWLILVLSIHAVRFAGAWVLAIGLARYTFAAASLLLPWLRADTPPRYWNKAVAAIQGVTLTVAAAQVLPRAAIEAALIIAAALLTESFGHQVAWLWRQRRGETLPPAQRSPGSWRSASLTVLAGLLLWVALVLPDQIHLLSATAFVRIPATWLIVVVLATLLPPVARRLAGAVIGILLALLVLVKLLDMAFFQAFNRPVNLLTDWTYFSPGLGVLIDTFGRTRASAILVVAALCIAVILTVLPWATLRLLRAVAQCPRRWSVRAVGALGVVWLVCAVTEVQAPGVPGNVASHAALRMVHQRFDAVWRGLADHRVFATQIADDPLAQMPAACLLSALEGKDVLLIFVESYGRVAVEGSSFAPGVDSVLAAGTRAMLAHGYGARSAFLVSPTFGGASWLAHSTLESGLWIDTEQRYNQLLASNRTTLASAFQRAGWRTVSDVPADTGEWRQGKLFYRFDQLYNGSNVGYRGPRFSYAPMPDQYTLAAFRRLELTRPDRPLVFAEIDLVSSHDPWTPLPHLVPWDRIDDGTIFTPQPAEGLSPNLAFKSDQIVRALYGQSIEYSMNALFSFLTTYPDPNLVLIVLGDHQPWKIVSGNAPGHDVPVSIIAHDPAVLERIAEWNWQPGMLPGTTAPVWHMSAFRNRFLGAFSPDCTTGSNSRGQPMHSVRRAN